MKTETISVILLVACLLGACAQSNTFTITGNIQNVADGDSVYLYTVEGRMGRVYLRDAIENGKFSFEGETDSLKMLRMMVQGEQYPVTMIPIWIAPGAKIKITGENYFVSTWKISSRVKEQQEEELYREAVRDLEAVSDSIFRSYYRLFDARSSARNDEERARIEAEGMHARAQVDSLLFVKDRLVGELMATRPVTDSWIDRLATLAGNAVTFGRADKAGYPEANIRQLQNLYNRLTDEQKQSDKGQLIRRYIFPEFIEEGQAMATGKLYDPQGNVHSIAEEYTGKYVLLDFWGVGCPPCIAAFDEMKRLYKGYAGKLTIISITVDTEKVWLEGLEKHRLPWVNLTDHQGLEGYASQYGVRGIPFYVLISPEGTVEKIWKGYGKGSLTEVLKDKL
ncbi:MAG TPA: hypothetical protein DDW85_01185 [Porphyromonadaceae bacterium]|jgi:thiol-disulfide isomerase/thioredoxin|nr:hypothetical protein [Porphyromonadaceae bacterium]